MSSFDIISLLLNIISGSKDLSHLALGCLGLLARIEHFQRKIADLNNLGVSVLDSIAKAITL